MTDILTAKAVAKTASFIYSHLAARRTMKLTATPLLGQQQQQKASSSFFIPNLEPRQFVDWMDSHKALLLQSPNGNSPLSVDDFADLVVSLQLENYPYIGGAAPRTIIPVKAGNHIVFTANESPPEEPIPFHHELAQTPNPPEYIFFYCDTPAETGGETPIIDSTEVFRFVKDHHPDFLQKLVEHGVRYLRTLPETTDATSPIGRSYYESYNVSSKEELEEKLSKKEGCSWEWLESGSVRITTEAVPAIRLITEHCGNQVFQYAFANSIVAAFLGWQDTRNDRHEALRFGDMTRMDETVLQSIADFMHANRILYKWKKGDIMALNNQLVMHSRNPFSGTRRVFASIWGPPKDEIRTIKAPNGVAIGVEQPILTPLVPADPLVFGFWKIPKETCADIAYNAIKNGYRRLDCACDYGNEEQVGQGIALAIQDGLCQRDDLFITSKLWNTYHKPEHVPLALDRTLNDLQLSYLDEYLIHFPISMEFVSFEDKYPPEWTNMDGKMVLVPNDLGATWKAMEDLVDKNLCRTIGVCNFSTQLLRQLLSTCRIRPSTLQVELHPHNAQKNLVRFAREAGMRVTAFSVLGASSYLELDMATPADVLLKDGLIQNIAKAKKKTPAQILLRWALQRNTQPLCKTSTGKRMQENRNIFDFYLTAEEMKRINSLDIGRRYNDPGNFCEAGMGTFCPIYD